MTGNADHQVRDPDAASRALETWVLSRQDGAWRAQAFRNWPKRVNRGAE
jgi:hypothetical protein